MLPVRREETGGTRARPPPGGADLEEAEAEVDARLSALGEEHPDTLASRDNLARVLGRRGEFEYAAMENLTVLRVRRRVLGEEHPDTLASRHELDVVLLVRRAGTFSTDESE
ncbi:tetratricopeptide repeat protein [Nonomuraea deserti]|uniref:Tetratricopeptide repeat protein n=1 Tax=Nonomuraea deserti TaxID=1848322 RepID=A0A4R4VCU5_9ACTN|nr:tetratricopeptide repeat protein [Nonomuraea deserti]